MRSILLLLVIIIFYSCSNRNKVPEHVLSIKEMYPVMWDLARADVLVTYTHKDTLARKRYLDTLYSRVFDIHDITSEKFRESLGYYERHPEILKVLMDSLRGYERRVLNEPERREIPGQGTSRPQSPVPVRDSMGKPVRQ